MGIIESNILKAHVFKIETKRILRHGLDRRNC